MIQVTPQIAIEEGELEEHFIRASGSGGQNVNKVATAVHLRFDVAGSPSLPDEVRDRLTRLAGRRMTREGVLVIKARRYRGQERNRQDARDRLVALIRRAAAPATPDPAVEGRRSSASGRQEGTRPDQGSPTSSGRGRHLTALGD